MDAATETETFEDRMDREKKERLARIKKTEDVFRQVFKSLGYKVVEPQEPNTWRPTAVCRNLAAVKVLLLGTKLTDPERQGGAFVFYLNGAGMDDTDAAYGTVSAGRDTVRMELRSLTLEKAKKIAAVLNEE